MRDNDLQPLLPKESLQSAAKDAMRALYDTLDGEVLDLSDV